MGVLVVPISKYLERLEKLGEAGLLASLQAPALVFQPFAALDDTGFQTVNMETPSREGGGYLVAEIRKRRGANAFSMMITLGRAANNDIQLGARGISKFHAYLRVENGVVTITDAGSSFGTHVDGNALTPRSERAVLSSGASVRFGDAVHATFLEPKELCEFLHQVQASRA